jgi:hypothetical protein
MWQHYRKTLIPTQLFIIVGCALLLLIGKMPLSAVLLIFAVMQLGAIIGASWAARLKRRVLLGRHASPLMPR